jgi:hypothetical protein
MENGDKGLKMQEINDSFQFKSELTEDGSPTVRLPPTWEPMHALDGAFTETLYIYQPTVRDSLKASQNTRIISIGLGLGYNEILTACECITQNKSANIDSYESVPELRTYFTKWINGEQNPFQDIYENILKFFTNSYSLNTEQVKNTLKSQLSSEQLLLHPAITTETQFQKSHGIFFDAFSSKSSPELWTEEFLEHFIKTATAETCYLSTYASKGALHRTLRSHNFVSEKRAGFGKKRESTFAHRITN